MHDEPCDDAEANHNPETAQAKPPRGRFAVLLSILALVASAFVFVLWDSSRLARSLAVVTQDKVKENAMRDGYVDMKNVTSEVVASRDFVFFGAATGKLTVFMRDGDDYGGIDYFYNLRDGEWVFFESGACFGEESRARAMRAFGIE
jgi:hypothetical protein